MTVTAISNLFTSQIFATLVQCPEKVHLWEALFSNYKKHFATFLQPMCTPTAPYVHPNCTFSAPQLHLLWTRRLTVARTAPLAMGRAPSDCARGKKPLTHSKRTESWAGSRQSLPRSLAPHTRRSSTSSASTVLCREGRGQGARRRWSGAHKTWYAPTKRPMTSSPSGMSRPPSHRPRLPRSPSFRRQDGRQGVDQHARRRRRGRAPVLATGQEARKCHAALMHKEPELYPSRRRRPRRHRGLRKSSSVGRECAHLWARVCLVYASCVFVFCIVQS